MAAMSYETWAMRLTSAGPASPATSGQRPSTMRTLAMACSSAVARRASSMPRDGSTAVDAPAASGELAGQRQRVATGTRPDVQPRLAGLDEHQQLLEDGSSVRVGSARNRPVTGA